MNPYRWVMLGLAWAAYASFGLVSASLAPLVTPITAELGITYAQMGMILGAWQLAYIGVAYNAGRVLDRVGLRRGLGVGILVIAASALARSRLVSAEHRVWAVALMLAVSAAATAAIALGSGPLLLGALVVQGFVRSSVTPFLMLLMMESPAVGAAAMGAAAGLFFTVGEIGGFAGPSAMGVIFDLTGGFTLGLFALAAVLLAMAIACLGLERQRPALAA